MVLLWLHSFCLGVGVAYLLSAALSIFLAVYSIEYLIGVFAVAGVVEFVIGNLLQRFEHRFGEAKTLRSILIFLVAGTVIFWFLLRGTYVHPYGDPFALTMIFGLLVWARILIYVSDNAFWSLPQHFFDIRQSKRLYSLIDSGSFFASILGYFSVPIVTQFVAVPDLLIPSFLGTSGGLILLQRIFTEYSHLLQHNAHRKDKSENKLVLHNRFGQHEGHENKARFFRLLGRHPYIASIITVSFFTGLANTCVDYGFLNGIELRSKNMAQIAAFLGLFLGGAKLLSFLLKIGIVGRLFSKFGLGKTSFVLPAGLIIATMAGLVFPSTNSRSAMIWSFTACMLLMELWSDAVQVPALAISLQPLTPHERHLGHRMIDGFIEPLTLLFAAILLYVLTASVGFALRVISISLLGIFVLWAITILVFDREYKSYVLNALKHRRLRPLEFVWDEDTRKVIARKLHGSNTAEAAYALRLIPARETKFFLEVLPELLNRGDRDMKFAVLNRLEDFEWSFSERVLVASVLEEIITQQESDPILLGSALHELAFIQREFDPEYWKKWLVDERLPIRIGVLSGLIKFKEEGFFVSTSYLQALQNSAITEERAAVAEIVNRVHSHTFYQPLIQLLKDPDRAVRTSALRASARIGHSELIEPILDQYLDSSVSGPMLNLLEDSLRVSGVALFPLLKQRIVDGKVDSIRLHRITRMLGYWCKPENSNARLREQSIDLLIAFLNWNKYDPSKELQPRTVASLRLAALRELVTNRIPISNNNILENLNFEEFHRAQDLFQILKPVHESSFRAKTRLLPVGLLLRGTISYELAQLLERVLLLLSLQFDSQTLQRVRDTLLLGDKRHRANAYETLEHILPGNISSPLVALIEVNALLRKVNYYREGADSGEDEAALIDILETMPNMTGKSSTALLEDLILNKERFYEPWTIEIANFWTILLNTEPLQNSTEEPPMPLPFERVILLKTVDLFRETPDPILGHLAQGMEEVHVTAGERIIEKGEMGQCLYIIIEGCVKVHDGNVQFAILSNRDVVGELSVLDPEPRSASVTAMEETTLLRLDYDVFYDLMIDNIEIARGAIAMLCRRIRNQNAITTQSRATMVGATQP